MRLTCGVVFGVSLLLGTARAHDPINSKVTWDSDISRLVQARCLGCHVPEGRGPMPLTTYEDARPWARAIREEVLTRRMPKWHAARGYGQFANDRSLTPFEIALIVAWVDGGAVKSRPGDVAQAFPPSRVPPTSDALRRDLAEALAEAGRPAPAGASAVAEAFPGAATRTLTLPCGDKPVTGTLVAITPRLEPGGSAGITVRLPDGRREIVAWIRDFDPGFADTYWLRTPLVMPAGSRLLVEAPGRCSIELGLRQAATARRSQTVR